MSLDKQNQIQSITRLIDPYLRLRNFHELIQVPERKFSPITLKDTNFLFSDRWKPNITRQNRWRGRTIRF